MRRNDAKPHSPPNQQLGVEDYRRAIGHAFSTRTAPAPFRRTPGAAMVAAKTGAVGIYLDENPPAVRIHERQLYVPLSLRPLQS